MSRFDKRNKRGRWVENPYETNYDCFHIRDFKTGDSILVYEDGERIRGVVTDVSFEKRSVKYKSSYSDSNTTTINKILLLKEHTKGWLKTPENGVN